MNTKIKTFIYAAAALFCLPACTNNGTDTIGTNYYLDAENGSDANDGLSADKAWKSIAKANETALQPGDSLLFRRGCTFSGILEISASGTQANRVTVDAYGAGDKPCIAAPDSSLYAVFINNSNYLTIQNLDITSHGRARVAKRSGIKVLCRNYGTSKGVTLNALDIHDVNGSLVKEEGGGSGILIESGWNKDSIVSVFDSLTIENCTIRRCERNGIIWGAPWSRKDWHPSTNVIVRNNLIEEVPGDGIVPIGCDGAIVEYNLMRNCPEMLPDGQAAAGIWPWSCDNTVIQFNEVSDHKAPWDGQGFDSDYNCTNTTIQYNYSHNNDGGFILLCNSGSEGPGPQDNIGNIGSIVRYNVSIGDAVRQRKTRAGIFSPTIHIGGPIKNSIVEKNILHIGTKPSQTVDRCAITSDSWGGYADSTFFRDNIFFAPEPSSFRLTHSTNNVFEGNYFIGQFVDNPYDSSAQNASEEYSSLFKDTEDATTALSFLFENVEVGDGAARIQAVRKDAVEDLFRRIKSARK